MVYTHCHVYSQQVMSPETHQSAQSKQDHSFDSNLQQGYTNERIYKSETFTTGRTKTNRAEDQILAPGMEYKAPKQSTIAQTPHMASIVKELPIRIMRHKNTGMNTRPSDARYT